MISLECKGYVFILFYECGIVECFCEVIICCYFFCGYLFDFFCLVVEEGFLEGFYIFGEIVFDDFFQSVYYQIYYFGVGVVEDVYYIFDFGFIEKFLICFYNGFLVSCYSDVQVVVFVGLVLLVLELVWQFCVGCVDFLLNLQVDFVLCFQEVLCGFGCDVFIDCECEVCYLLFSGYLVKFSVWLMDIFLEIVCMYWKNFYIKLEVGLQLELFVLFIECLSQGQCVGF